MIGPLRRGEPVSTHDGARIDAVLLCVPEQELQAAAAIVPRGIVVGHCSASAPLDLLAPHEAFSLHPLMTLQGAETRLAGAWCALSATSAQAREIALSLAGALSMPPLDVPDEKRALYHAAASMSSNFLVTLEGAAERAAAACGVPRSALMPLVLATIDAWSRRGFDGAITGPVSRGDAVTVAKQRAALGDSVPDLVPLFDALTVATQSALSMRARGVGTADA